MRCRTNLDLTTSEKPPAGPVRVGALRFRHASDPPPMPRRGRDIAGDGPPVRLTDRDDPNGRGRTARRDAELLEHDLGDDATDMRGYSKPTASGHRVIAIISNALGRTCGQQRHADAVGCRRLVAHRLAGCRGGALSNHQPLALLPAQKQNGARRARARAAERDSKSQLFKDNDVNITCHGAAGP